MKKIIIFIYANIFFIHRVSAMSKPVQLRAAVCRRVAIARSKPNPRVPQLWKHHHEQAIRHKILLNEDRILKNIEKHEWVVTNEGGKTWQKYNESAVITYVREKKETRLRGNGFFLAQYNSHFKWSADKDAITFSSHQNNDRFSMAINIDGKRLDGKETGPIDIDGLLIDPESDLTKKDIEIAERSAEFIGHFQMNIPWYIALKSLETRPLETLNDHQILHWASLSANGYNLLTQTASDQLYLWSIEHLVANE